MKALAIVDKFGLENLQWIERDRPEPGPNEVLVRMKAASLNHRDLEVIGGQRKLALPLIPASDAAGVVVAVGRGVESLAVGDRVMPIFVQGWLAGPQPPGDALATLGGPLDGVLVEFGSWPELGLVRVPDGLSDVEAATLPCAGVSAWNALFVCASLRPGDTVLIQGTGGVSLFALQFAKLAGARVIVTSSSDQKLDRARAMGADHGINYRHEPEWGRAARAIAGTGVDCVVEVGGSGSLEQSLIAVKNGGHVSYVGALSGTKPTFDLGELSRKSVQLRGVRVGNRESFETMCRAISLHALKPVIDAVFDFGDAIGALQRLQSGGHFGKICVSFG
ncbi:MAG: NAD(P)-dependent alcohol dehydrogenase [Proteobacteria bacterium]|nr:NAD(P)-dependent alcohol dehydrogenase [Pseudomonadota bacterium]